MATYYIDHDGGNDGSDGLTSGAAKLHIPTLSAGDTVKFKLGVVYPHSYTTVAANCTFTVETGWGTGQATWGDNSISTEWILLVQHGGTLVTGISASHELKFTGTGITKGAVGFMNDVRALDGCRALYLELDTVATVGADEGIGIKMGVGGYANAVTNFEISNCLVHSCYSFGLKVSGGAAALSGSIHHCTVYANCARRAVDAISDTNINISSNEVTSCSINIYNNTVYSPSHAFDYNLEINMVGVNVYDNDIYDGKYGGIKTDLDYNTTLAGYLNIYRNKIYNSGGNGGIIIGSGSSTRINKIYNNLLYNNLDYQIYGMEDGSYSQIYFNTIYSDTSQGGIKFYTGATNTDIRDNIIDVDAYACIWTMTTTGVVEDYNVLNGRNAIALVCDGSPGAHDVVADPLLVTPPTDLTIPTGSPAKDAGTALGISFDYLNLMRPVGAGYDIGAYEFGAGPGTWVMIYG